MSNRVTIIGHAFFIPKKASDREYAIQEVTDSLNRTGGNVTRSAHELCMCRRHLYRIIDEADLWGVVDAARERSESRRATIEASDWLATTRKALLK